MKETERKIRSYTEEFKNQALELARELGSVRKAALQLGISANTLHGWTYKRRDRESDDASGLKSPALRAQATPPNPAQVEEENRRLRRENEQLKKANYILKQAAAFFSQDHLK